MAEQFKFHMAATVSKRMPQSKGSDISVPKAQRAYSLSISESCPRGTRFVAVCGMEIELLCPGSAGPGLEGQRCEDVDPPENTCVNKAGP